MPEHNQFIKINLPKMALTKREKEVFRAIVTNVRGVNYKTLAQNLNITESTFKRHLDHIFQKTSTGTQIELIIKHYLGEIDANNNFEPIRKNS
jgi:DNA-binding NarL/FixJ family response regulator